MLFFLSSRELVYSIVTHGDAINKPPVACSLTISSTKGTLAQCMHYIWIHRKNWHTTSRLVSESSAPINVNPLPPQYGIGGDRVGIRNPGGIIPT